MRRLLAASLLCVSLCASAAAQDPRQEGEALRTRLSAEGPVAALAGIQRLRVHLGSSRPLGSLVLRTDLVERDGVKLYRLIDRLNLDLPRLGSARLRVEADLTADLRPLRVVLETEEPRGAGVLSRQVIVLQRDAQKNRWLRSVTQGYGAPVSTEVELPDDVLVLTPPVGVGERLARLVPGAVGQRYKLPAYDLETGLTTSWRLTVEEEAEVQFKGGAAPVPALRLTRYEGPAKLDVLRDRAVGGAVLRMQRMGTSRLSFLDPRLLSPRGELVAGPIACVLVFLRSVAAADKQAVLECLDVDALYASAGGAADDQARRARFQDVLLERLTDAAWLEAQGLLLVASAAEADDLLVEGPEGGPVSVRPRRGSGRAFTLARRGEAWRIVALPPAE